jgi:hypothetical protein
MADDAIVCPKCRQPMLKGFLADHTAFSGEGAREGEWIEGPLELGWFGFGGVKRDGRKAFVIAGYRCSGCGYLELYAK